MNKIPNLVVALTIKLEDQSGCLNKACSEDRFTARIGIEKMERSNVCLPSTSRQKISGITYLYSYLLFQQLQEVGILSWLKTTLW